MPEVKQQDVLTIVTLKPGEKVALCRCYGSKKFPFCDGTHKQHPGKGPAIVEIKPEEEKEE